MLGLRRERAACPAADRRRSRSSRPRRSCRSHRRPFPRDRPRSARWRTAPRGKSSLSRNLLQRFVQEKERADRAPGSSFGSNSRRSAREAAKPREKGRSLEAGDFHFSSNTVSLKGGGNRVVTLCVPCTSVQQAG